MVKLGRMMTGGESPKRKRRKHEFYETPLLATLGLIQAERRHLSDLVAWECATGKDALARPLRSICEAVYTSDLIERLPPRPNHFPNVDFLGYYDDNADNLMKSIRIAHHGSRIGIVTNPPFKYAIDFIDRALNHYQADYLALFLKSTFFHADSRANVFETLGPTVRYDLTWRCDFTGEGKPTMEGTWFVWDRARGPLKQWRLIRRPAKILLDLF